MKTRVLKVSKSSVAEAAAVLRAGGLVAFPTETVYGLGARAFDAAAARRVYRAKGRPSSNPLIVHVDGPAMLPLVARRASPLARRLMAAFWPGPLTLVFDKTARVPGAVTGRRDTVAVRCPGHPAARALIRALGEPIAAPSANRSGRPSPTAAEHVRRDLAGRVPLILDGGPCRRGLESAIVDARGRRPVLLRPGTLSPEVLARAAGAALAAPGPSAPAAPQPPVAAVAPKLRPPNSATAAAIAIAWYASGRARSEPSHTSRNPRERDWVAAVCTSDSIRLSARLAAAGRASGIAAASIVCAGMSSARRSSACSGYERSTASNASPLARRCTHRSMISPKSVSVSISPVTFPTLPAAPAVPASASP